MSDTPKCDNFHSIHKFFTSEDMPDNELLLSKSAAYLSLLRLAMSLESQLSKLQKD